MSKEVGARVQQVRSQAEMNQREFASRLGISSGGISQIESGKTMPGGDFLLKIHQEFGIDVTWLLTGLSMGGAAAAPVVEPTPQLSRRALAVAQNYEATSEEGKKIIEAAAFAAAKPAAKRGAKAA